jgi:hypothetical protein
MSTLQPTADRLTLAIAHAAAVCRAHTAAYAVADHLTRQFEYAFEFDTGSYVPVHAAADAAVAAVPPPRFSTSLSINVPTPQPTSSPTRYTLRPS